MDKEKQTLANYIRSYRKEHKLSQLEFAARCGISADSLCLIERAKANPTLETLLKIAAYIGVSVARLLTVPEE